MAVPLWMLSRFAGGIMLTLPAPKNHKTIVHIASNWPTCHTISDISQTNTGCQGVVVMDYIMREEAPALDWDESERELNVSARIFELHLFALCSLTPGWSVVF